jgi:hypothetical protein
MHTFQHTAQLIYEIILLIKALAVDHNKVILLPIVCGLVGSALGMIGRKLKWTWAAAIDVLLNWYLHFLHSTVLLLQCSSVWSL